MNTNILLIAGGIELTGTAITYLLWRVLFPNRAAPEWKLIIVSFFWWLAWPVLALMKNRIMEPTQ